MQEEQKKLLVGETVLAKTFRTDKDNIIHSLEVRYGNVLYPPVNGQIVHIETDEEYKEILRNFLDDHQPEDVDYQIMHDGSLYEIPSEEDVDKATIEMLNREQRAKNKIKKKEEETKSKELKLSEIQNEIAKAEQEETTDAQVELPMEQPQQPQVAPVMLNTQELESKLSSRFDTLEQIIEQNDAEHQILARQLRFRKILSLVLGGLLLLSLAGLARMYYLRNKPVDATYTLININGIDYQVPLANVEVEDGQKKILIYGFTSTMENGEVKHEAIPLGEFYMDKESIKEEAPEEIVEEVIEESQEVADSENE